jgi:serine/threonine-protein kinase
MPQQAPSESARSYVMHRAIASGGMATVHLGRLFASGGFTRRVAIKRLLPHLAADPEIAAGFAEEARLSSRVAHVNVVAILDVVSAEGELLLVMEYVHGESLARLLSLSRVQGAPAPVAIVARVLADALHGLHASHEATAEDGTPMRLVHRDVSPQNILVGTDGAARVVDFGIAKTIASAHNTSDGQVKGKMPYLSPEQLLRRALDRRTDVYAAGVTLWEALAGKRLFSAEDEASLFTKILEEPVVPPSRVDARVPPELDAIVMRAIDRDPDRRFGTAREMAVALEGTAALAPPSVVAEWVSATARDALARREAVITEMEREPTVEHEDLPLRIRIPSASVVLRDASASDDALILPRSSAAAEETTRVTVGEIQRRPRLRGRAAFVAAGAVVLAVLTLVTLGSVKRSAAHRAAESAKAVVQPAPESSPSVPTMVSSSATADPAPVAPPAASSASPASSASTARPSRARPSIAEPPPARWCKVFDSERHIFVMKQLRIARCP